MAANSAFLELETALCHPERCRELSFHYSNGTYYERIPRAIVQLPLLERLTLGVHCDFPLDATLLALPQLKKLTLCHSWSRVPDIIFELPHLESLELNCARLRELPPQLNRLNKLRSLSLTDCGSLRFPDRLSEWPELEVLRLTGSRRSQLTGGLAGLGMRRLEWEGIPVAQLPAWKDVRELRITLSSVRTGIPVIADRFPHLDSLEILGERTILQDRLPPELARLTGLRALACHHAGLTELPGDLARLPALESVELVSNPVARFPDVLVQCRGVKRFAISQKTYCEKLVDRVAEMPALQKLILDRTIGSPDPQPLPERLSRAVGLTELTVARANIRDISGIQALHKLTALDLSDNPIEDLTPLSALKDLQTLDLSGLKAVGSLEALRGLPHLRELTIYGAKVRDLIPGQFGAALAELPHLQSLRADESVETAYAWAKTQGAPLQGEEIRKLVADPQPESTRRGLHALRRYVELGAIDRGQPGGELRRLFGAKPSESAVAIPALTEALGRVMDTMTGSLALDLFEAAYPRAGDNAELAVQVARWVARHGDEAALCALARACGLRWRGPSAPSFDRLAPGSVPELLLTQVLPQVGLSAKLTVLETIEAGTLRNGYFLDLLQTALKDSPSADQVERLADILQKLTWGWMFHKNSAMVQERIDSLLKESGIASSPSIKAVRARLDDLGQLKKTAQAGGTAAVRAIIQRLRTGEGALSHFERALIEHDLIMRVRQEPAPFRKVIQEAAASPGQPDDLTLALWLELFDEEPEETARDVKRLLAADPARRERFRDALTGSRAKHVSPKAAAEAERLVESLGWPYSQWERSLASASDPEEWERLDRQLDHAGDLVALTGLLLAHWHTRWVKAMKEKNPAGAWKVVDLYDRWRPKMDPDVLLHDEIAADAVAMLCLERRSAVEKKVFGSWVRTAPRHGRLAFNLACFHARTQNKQAMLEAMAAALGLGKTPAEFQQDDDFKAYRNDPDFKRLLAQP